MDNIVYSRCVLTGYRGQSALETSNFRQRSMGHIEERVRQYHPWEQL